MIKVVSTLKVFLVQKPLLFLLIISLHNRKLVFLAARAKGYTAEVDENSTLDLDIIWPDEVKAYKKIFL